ncbi:MAG: hypothetical protein AAGA61_10010 [Pseudomonadota bacterium]
MVANKCVLLGVVALMGCAVAEEAADSAWTQGIDEDIAYETVRVLAQTSSDSIADEYSNKQVNPVIQFRCTEGGDSSVSMQIAWQRFISSFNTEAGFQVDDGKRNWIKLGVDDSNAVTRSRSESDVTTLIASLSAGTSLSVEIEPYSEPAVRVSFDLRGFAAGIAALREACT